MIHWLTINNHPIPPFPSIAWLSTSKSRWRILQRLPPQVGHGILSDVSENSTSVAWLVVDLPTPLKNDGVRQMGL